MARDQGVSLFAPAYRDRARMARNESVPVASPDIHGAVAQAEQGGGIDGLKQLFRLNFVQCLRQISFDSRQRQSFRWITPDCSFSQEKAKEDLQCHDDQFDRGRGQTGPFSLGQILGNMVDRDFAGTFQAIPAPAPYREFRQGASGGKLVIFREPALDCEISHKGIYLVFHVRISG